MRSGASVIALCCGSVFGLASVGRAATQAEIEQAILTALSNFGSQGTEYLFTIPLSTDQIDYMAALGDLLSYDPSDANTTVGRSAYTSTIHLYDGLFDHSNPANKIPYLSLILAALQAQQAGDTNLIALLQPVLAPSSLPNLYAMVKQGFDGTDSALASVDGRLGYMDGQYFSDLDDIKQYLTSSDMSLSSLVQALTVSGASGLGDPALEVNDSNTHDLLTEIISNLSGVQSGQNASQSSASALYSLVQGIQYTLELMYDKQDSMDSMLSSAFVDDASEVSPARHGFQVYDPFQKLEYQYTTNFWNGFVKNAMVGTGTNRAVRVSIDPAIVRTLSAYTNAVLGSYTGQVATISTNPIPERQEGLNPEDSQDYTQSLSDSFDDVDSMLDPLRSIGSRIENISIDPDFGDNSGNSRFYIIRPENAFWNSFSFMRSRSSDSDGGIYIDFAEGDLRNFCTKCNGFLEALIHWLEPILIFLVMYHEARWTLNFFHHDRDL